MFVIVGTVVVDELPEFFSSTTRTIASTVAFAMPANPTDSSVPWHPIAESGELDRAVHAASTSYMGRFFAAFGGFNFSPVVAGSCFVEIVPSYYSMSG